MSNKLVKKTCLAVWAASAVVCASAEVTTVAEMTGAELAEKGFAVTLAEKTDSALLEIVRLASDR